VRVALVQQELVPAIAKQKKLVPIVWDSRLGASRDDGSHPGDQSCRSVSEQVEPQITRHREQIKGGQGQRGFLIRRPLTCASFRACCEELGPTAGRLRCARRGDQELL